MRQAHLQGEFEKLLAYPEHCFGERASEKWLSLCSSLSNYQAPSTSFPIEKNRKWELTSALQKSIRRADKTTALQLIAGIANMPEEYGYFLRRMCVIACEDVGPADDTLVRFTIACATIFSPKKLATDNHTLLCFLAEQMCDRPVRSRIYCSYSAIEPGIISSDLPQLSGADESIVSAIRKRLKAAQAQGNPQLAWQKKNDWRAEGLLKFVGLSLSEESCVNTDPLPPSRTIFDLPSYCYDMHTRIGLSVLHRLIRGTHGARGIREFFRQNRTNLAHKAVGEALFTVEGGREKCELVYPALCSLEQRVSAHQFGLSFDQWLRLCDLTRKALEDGVIDRLREEVLRRQYGQKKLQLIAPEEQAMSNTTN